MAAIRANRRAGADPVGAFIALASDPDAFAARKAELDERIARAEEAETAAAASIAAAKIEQDGIARDRAAFNIWHTEARAKLATDRDEWNALAKAENARLVNWDGELANRERAAAQLEERAREREAKAIGDSKAAESARQAFEQARDQAAATFRSAKNINDVVNARAAKLLAAINDPIMTATEAEAALKA